MEARGKSSAMSAANAIANHLRDWLSAPLADPPRARTAPSGLLGDGAGIAYEEAEHCVSMGVATDGNTYGVPDGLFFSFPTECSQGLIAGGNFCSGFCVV